MQRIVKDRKVGCPLEIKAFPNFFVPELRIDKGEVQQNKMDFLMVFAFKHRSRLVSLKPAMSSAS